MSESSKTIRVASRKSPLARRQTELAIDALSAFNPSWTFEVCLMSTTGDERLEWSLETSGGKGLFTSELERAIAAKEADLAVHSAKDLPTEMAEGICLAGYLPRASAGDVLIRRVNVQQPTFIATASPRRRAQIKPVYPNAEWKEIRGNVGTRLGKIADGYADATIMAAAGLDRLGIEEWPGLVFEPLGIEQSVPAAGQGAIGVQCRCEDIQQWADLLCSETRYAVTIERAVLAALGGGCHSASAAHYVDGILYVFHEGKGFHRFPFDAQESDIESTVTHLLANL